MKRTILTVGLSAMLAMPMLAVGQQSTTPGTSGGMGPGGSSSGSRMERHGQQELSQEQIREAQKQLKQAGFYQGSIDGLLGQQTQEAIREYQKARGLPQTGQLDEPTKELLMAQGTMPGGTGSGGTGSGGTMPPGGHTMPGGSTGGTGSGGTGTGSTGSGSSTGGSSSGR